MPHFSRLTDIVTCSLSEILGEADDPLETLREVIEEMKEGLAGARRSARTAAGTRDRLRTEIAEYNELITRWTTTAREALTAGNEQSAREALTRKVEAEDLIEGLQPELEAAESTTRHMERIQKALEARHAEAIRRLSEMTGTEEPVRLESETAVRSFEQSRTERNDEVEAELERLRRQLQQE